MSPEFVNTIATIAGVIVAILGAFLFAFWIAMGIWTFNDIRARSRDWLAIILAIVLVLIFPIIGWILYMMIRPKATLAEVYDRALEEETLLRELEETLTCHTCGIPVKDNWVYCPNCHSQLQHSCGTCGTLARNEWEICVNCGAPQRAPSPPKQQRKPQQSPQPQPERTPQPAQAQRAQTPLSGQPTAPADDSTYHPR